MALRITVSTDGQTTEVRLEGRLEAIGVPDLQESCRSAGPPLRLDLSGLRSADEVGVQALQLLRAQGAEFCGASPYIGELLRAKRP